MVNSYIISTTLPIKLDEFYLIIKSGYFFKDMKYGQWGLRILSSKECKDKSNYWRKHRKEDFNTKIWVVGEFFGDSDLLVYDDNLSCLFVSPKTK